MLALFRSGARDRDWVARRFRLRSARGCSLRDNLCSGPRQMRSHFLIPGSAPGWRRAEPQAAMLWCGACYTVAGRYCETLPARM